MKELLILSGKGGTGKTTIVGSFAVLAKNKVLVDCDVDAADLHLLLAPSLRQQTEFWSGQVASIDEKKCIQCGLCEKLCRFEAIKDFQVNPLSCEGCGFCSHICPVDAVTMRDNLAGHWFISDTGYGVLVHARLGIAQENSGKLVALVRQQAKKIAKEKGLDYIISDGPPGIGCPVISSLSGTDMALLVTEPTMSGIHDLERVIELCRHFNISVKACINKYNLNRENSQEIERFCSLQNIGVAGKIPFGNIVTEALVQGIPVVQYSDGRVSQELKQLWNSVFEILKQKDRVKR